MSPFLIYGLTDPRTDQIRYIGKSSSGLGRIKAHRNALHRERTHKANWMRELRDAGLSYGHRVLEELASGDGINAAEMRWIAHGRAQGWSLTNLTDGGDGLAGHVHSDEHKKKIGASKIGKPRDAATRAAISEACHRPDRVAKMRAANLGKIVSDETRAKLSQSHRGLSPSEKTRAKMAESGRRRHRENPLSAEIRAKAAADRKGIIPVAAIEAARIANTGRPLSDEHRQAIADSLKGRPTPWREGAKDSPETIERKRAAHLGKRPSEETRAKLREAARLREARRRADTPTT